MARRTITTEEKKNKIKEEINNLDSVIKKATEKKNELTKELDNIKKNEYMQVINELELSPTELKDFIKKIKLEQKLPNNN